MTRKTSFLSSATLISMLLLGHSVYPLESIDIGLNLDKCNVEDKPGSTEQDGTTFTIKAWGWDIWEDTDGFRLVYTEASGDFEAQVHLISFEPLNEWSKAAIMARQSADLDAANIMAAVTGGGASGAQVTWRPSKGEPTSEFFDIAPGEWSKGCWLKLARTGNEFHGYISKTGEKWEDMLFQEVEMNGPVLVGLAVTACTAIAQDDWVMEGPPVTAVFDQFTITQNGESKTFAVKPEGNLPVTWGKVKSGF